MELLQKLFGKKTLKQESDFLVSDDGNAILVKLPDGNKQSIRWNDLSVVEVQTSDAWALDVWFVLKSDSDELSFPLGASGNKKIIERLEKLPGFEMKGMNSVSDATFKCWEKMGAL